MKVPLKVVGGLYGYVTIITYFGFFHKIKHWDKFYGPFHDKPITRFIVMSGLLVVNSIFWPVTVPYTIYNENFCKKQESKFYD